MYPLFEFCSLGRCAKRGICKDDLASSTAAVACYDEVIARFGDSDALSLLQERVAWALYAKGDMQVTTRRVRGCGFCLR